MSQNNVHAAAQTGFSQESGLAYEKGRPSYSHESAALISKTLFENRERVASAANDNSVNIVEIGAGTGKFTEAYVPYFHQHYPDHSLTWTAIEPSDGFREILDKKKIPSVQGVKGTAAAIPSESKSADAVMFAQAFHWMDNIDTLRETHRVLKPNGLMVMIWNTYDYSKEWMRIVDQEILTPAYGDVPRQQSEKWRLCFQLEEAKALFSPLHGWYNPYVFTGDREMVLNRFLSTSVIVNLAPAEKAKVVDRLNDLLNNHSDFAEARATGTYVIPYVTHVAWVYAQ